MLPITFITTTLNTKWSEYQASLTKMCFPGIQHLHIDGGNNWPYVWYKWLSICNQIKTKYIVLVDEDFFMFDSKPLEQLIQFLDQNDYDTSGIADGYHQYRQQNPLAFNSFFQVIRTESLLKLLKPLSMFDRFFKKKDIQKYFRVPVVREFDASWMQEEYPHTKFADAKFSEKNFEPYYPFYWTLRANGFKFHYLYPHFDNQYKSTNPRMNATSEDIGIHMWFTRKWNDDVMDIHGSTNLKRYTDLEKKIKSFLFST